MDKCSVDGCSRPLAVQKHRLCNAHYLKLRRYGNVHAGGTAILGNTLEERLMNCIDKTEDCWLWNRALDAYGYGMIRHNGKLLKAHRAVWELLVGPIPAGKLLDHMCQNRHCVNPAHLQVGTHQTNNENRQTMDRRNTSGYRGVSWNIEKKKWEVYTTHKGKRYRGGYFQDLEEANKAAVALRNTLHTNNLQDRE